MERDHVFGLTTPLVTTHNGVKMGKSVAGAVWLDRYDVGEHRDHRFIIVMIIMLFSILYRDLLSEYDYWQYWRNTADEDVIRCAVHCVSVLFLLVHLDIFAQIPEAVHRGAAESDRGDGIIVVRRTAQRCESGVGRCSDGDAAWL